MSRTPFLILLAVLAAGFSALLVARTAIAGWYSAEPSATGHRGWYAYEKYKKPQKKSTETVQPARKSKIRWPTYEEALKMEPSDLKKILKLATEEAVADPSEQNVTRWATI